MHDALSTGLVALTLLTTVGTSPFVTNTVGELVKAASDTCEVLPLDILFSWPSLPDLNVMEYTEDGSRSYRLKKAHKVLRGRLPRTLVVYIPGWWNTPTDESSYTLASSLLTRNPLVLILDTRFIFTLGYITSVSNVKAVAQSLFKFFSNLQQIGYPLSAIHVIGFSLGAHVAGIVGKLVQKRLHERLMRITALDPARPCFMKPTQYRLDKEDAKFVLVIHTSTGVVGIEEPLGDVDVYVNGIKLPQPECRGRAITLDCDHAVAWKIFSASILEKGALLGRECWSWSELTNEECSGDTTVVGYDSSPTLRGIYLQKTNVRESKELSVFNPFDLNSWLGR